jgi:hypothetical protein
MMMVGNMGVIIDGCLVDLDTNLKVVTAITLLVASIHVVLLSSS